MFKGVDFAKKRAATALYLASYFHACNEESRNFFSIANHLYNDEMQKDVHNRDTDLINNFKDLAKFVRAKNQAQWEWIDQHCADEIKQEAKIIEKLNLVEEEKEQQSDILLEKIMINDLIDPKKFKMTCKRAESNNKDRLFLIWAFKKLFSVPWLLAYEELTYTI